LLKRRLNHIAIGIAKIRRSNTGVGVAMGIAKFFTFDQSCRGSQKKLSSVMQDGGNGINGLEKWYQFKGLGLLPEVMESIG